MRTRPSRHIFLFCKDESGLVSEQDIKATKHRMRQEALRARALLSLSAADHEALVKNFFEAVSPEPDSVIAAYWPKDRELDTRPLIDELIARGHKVALPVVTKGSRILRFARWHNGIEMVVGAFGVYHPILNADTEFLEPDVVIAPMLAFDLKGRRLGYGGGYYDATLTDLRARCNVVAAGVGYAQQACLFPLPAEEHDARMDYIVTPQQILRF